MTSFSPPEGTAPELSTRPADRARQAWSTWLDEAHAHAQPMQPTLMSTEPRQTPTADALAACRLTVQLLHQAEHEARRRLDQDRSLHAKLLMLELTELTAQAVELLPDQSYPEHDERPRVEGTDPLELARQAEELPATLPIEQFPAGLPQLLVRLSRTIRSVS